MEPALTDVFQWFLIAAVAAVFSIVVWLVPLRLYIEALSAGVHVGFGNLIGMRLRKVIPSGVVRPSSPRPKPASTSTSTSSRRTTSQAVMCIA